MAETETAGALAPDGADELIRSGSAQLVDVRTPEEHEAGHITGDELIPFDRLKDRVDALDRGRPVLLYCRSGDRSAAAAQALRASGWDATSIDGGLLAWVDRGLPIEPSGGHVADRDVLPPV